MTTAQSVVEALKKFNVREQGDNVYRSASPFRQGSDGDSFKLTIEDGEHGVWYDFVSQSTGTLYGLAKHLGIALPQKTPQEDSRRAQSPEEYATSHGVNLDALRAAGWQIGTQDGRPCFYIATNTGTRYRFLDGAKPAWKSKTGYKACWYKLDEAVELAKTNRVPLVLCNGEPSAVAAQSKGVPATCTTGSGEKKMSETLLDELRKVYDGPVVVAMDCDDRGRSAGMQLRAQLRGAGYEVTVVNLGLGDKGDLADYLRLWSPGDLYALKDTATLELVPTLREIHSAADMQREDVAPVEYIVDDIMTTGCYILAGAPKSRKSFLALHIAVSVATGQPVFSTFEVKTQCSVLYLDLEMSKNSVHRRLESMNFGAWPKNLYFGFSDAWPNRGALAAQDLENVLDANKAIRLVIIDVLTQWREPVDPRAPVYSSDYDALKQIQRVAQRRNITIIVVHHTNKSKITKDDNPFDKISGSTGIAGAVDAMWLLTRDPDSEYASILRMTDRNIAGVDRVDLAWDDMLGSHVVDPKSKVLAATGPERRAVYDVIAKSSFAMTPKEIAADVGKDESITKKHLRRLTEDKLIERVGYGRYQAIPISNTIHSGNSSTSGNSGNSGNSSERELPDGWGRGTKSYQELPRVTGGGNSLVEHQEASNIGKIDKSYQSERFIYRDDVAKEILGMLRANRLPMHVIAKTLSVRQFGVAADEVEATVRALMTEGKIKEEHAAGATSYRSVEGL